MSEFLTFLKKIQKIIQLLKNLKFKLYYEKNKFILLTKNFKVIFSLTYSYEKKYKISFDYILAKKGRRVTCCPLNNQSIGIKWHNLKTGLKWHEFAFHFIISLTCNCKLLSYFLFAQKKVLFTKWIISPKNIYFK